MSNVKYNGLEFCSAESAFQATRFSTRQLQARFTRYAPFRAEYMGARARATEQNWINKQYDYMYQILKIKFSDPILRQKLLDTEDNILIVVNKNHEKNWGVCTCSRCNNQGENNLGKLLMQIRNEFRK